MASSKNEFNYLSDVLNKGYIFVTIYFFTETWDANDTDHYIENWKFIC